MTEQYIRDFPNEKGYIDLLHKTNKLKDGEFERRRLEKLQRQ
jgi:hypothetical protein